MTNEEKLQKKNQKLAATIKNLRYDLHQSELLQDHLQNHISDSHEEHARTLAPLIEYIIGTTAFKEAVIDEVKTVLDEQLEHTAFKHEDY